MTTMLSLILAFMLSIGGSPTASVNPAGCPGDTGIQAPIDNNICLGIIIKKPRLGQIQKKQSKPLQSRTLKPAAVLCLRDFQLKNCARRAITIIKVIGSIPWTR
jgi:hypothetical protein